MAKKGLQILLRIVGGLLLLIVVVAIAGFYWLHAHYQQFLKEKVPALVLAATDSIYHIQWQDAEIVFLKGSMTIANLQLIPDHRQAEMLRRQHKRVPPTLSTLRVPKVEIAGINWYKLLARRAFSCERVRIMNGDWLLECSPLDYEPPRKKKQERGRIGLISADYLDVISPKITYRYNGPRERFTCCFKGGSASLHHWLFNTNRQQDTCSFLYAREGLVRFKSFSLIKSNGAYQFSDPALDFKLDREEIQLKGINIRHMANTDPVSRGTKEIYDIRLPEVLIKGLNWNRLIEHNTLHVKKLITNRPEIQIHYYRANDKADNGKMGSYPHQLLLRMDVKTNIEDWKIEDGKFTFTEMTPKNDEGEIAFTNINGTLNNVTNMQAEISQNKTCTIQLKGKFQGKSNVDARFSLWLADTTGRFTLDGNFSNLDGKDVIKQVQAFTIVAVTSFHLNDMEMHLQGDGHFIAGQFTPRYQDLKISLAKFKSDMRTGSKGLFSFLGNVVLYPNNPMPGKEARSAGVSLVRDPEKGFIGNIWQSIYRGAKKAAVREKAIVTLTDGKENKPGDQKVHKGLFKRFFGKK